MFSKAVEVKGYCGLQTVPCDRKAVWRRPANGRLREEFFCDVHTPPWRREEYERLDRDPRTDAAAARARVEKKRAARKKTRTALPAKKKGGR